MACCRQSYFYKHNPNAMKKLILPSLLTLLLPAFAYSQYINGVALDSIDVPYMSVTAYSMPGASITVLVDYGQPLPADRLAVLKDEADTPVRFNSMTDAINYMHRYGYILDDVFVTGETSSNVYYMLRRQAAD